MNWIKVGRSSFNLDAVTYIDRQSSGAYRIYFGKASCMVSKEQAVEPEGELRRLQIPVPDAPPGSPKARSERRN